MITVGYVRTTYGTRNLEEVFDDVRKYAGWGNDMGKGLAVKGIFFDETPNTYTADTVEYLNNITRFAKNTDGIAGDRLVSFEYARF